MASSPPRADVVLAAVHFLADPAVASSPLAARIAFLENKGLTQPEIKQAMASYSPTANSSTSQAMPTSQLMLLSQTQNQPTWRDHAFMAGLVVACGYGLWQLIQKYLPVPTPTDLDDSQSKLIASISNANSTLDIVHKETTDVLCAIDSHSSTINAMIQDMDKQIKEMRESQENDISAIKSEVESIKVMLPKLIEKNSTTQISLLAELQTEVKSLKSLLVNRRFQPTSTYTPVTGSASGVLGTSEEGGQEGIKTIKDKPSIPAWQLEDKAPDV